jgi:hypothetical protein
LSETVQKLFADEQHDLVLFKQETNGKSGDRAIATFDPKGLVEVKGLIETPIGCVI